MNLKLLGKKIPQTTHEQKVEDCYNQLIDLLSHPSYENYELSKDVFRGLIETFCFKKIKAWNVIGGHRKTLIKEEILHLFEKVYDDCIFLEKESALKGYKIVKK